MKIPVAIKAGCCTSTNAVRAEIFLRFGLDAHAAASNAYFPQRMSVISLPERVETVRQAVFAVWDFLETAEDEGDVTRERRKAEVRADYELLENDVDIRHTDQ